MFIFRKERVRVPTYGDLTGELTRSIEKYTLRRSSLYKIYNSIKNKTKNKILYLLTKNDFYRFDYTHNMCSTCKKYFYNDPFADFMVNYGLRDELDQCRQCFCNQFNVKNNLESIIEFLKENLGGCIVKLHEPDINKQMLFIPRKTSQFLKMF